MDNRSISKEQEELILENQGLVGHVAKKFDNVGDYYEMFSVGELGLIKAALTYDKSKKIKFATYAVICIQNEILMFLKKEKNRAKEVSLELPVIRNEQGNEITIGEIIPSSETYFTEKIEDKEIVEQYINIILNLLKSRERLLMLYKISGMRQRNIAEKLDISQCHVSRLHRSLENKVKKYFDSNIEFQKSFDFHIIKNSYRIRFGVKDVSIFKEILVKLIQNLKTTMDLPRFRITRNRKRITIFVDAYFESFSFIAEIIREINEYVSN